MAYWVSGLLASCLMSSIVFLFPAFRGEAATGLVAPLPGAKARPRKCCVAGAWGGRLCGTRSWNDIDGPGRGGRV